MQELEDAAPTIELTDEQRAAIYETIDYDEATAEADLPKDVSNQIWGSSSNLF